jgi:hypothetical protein
MVVTVVCHISPLSTACKTHAVNVRMVNPTHKSDSPNVGANIAHIIQNTDANHRRTQVMIFT